MTLSRERMLRLQDMAGLVLDARKQALRRANEDGVDTTSKP